MTPTLEKFLSEFTALGGDANKWLYDAEPPRLTHAALHADVGSLQIYDDGDELTVCLEDKHHSHIATYNYLHEPEENRLKLVAQQTAQFVTDILADRVLFTVHFLGDQCRGSSHRILDQDFGSSQSLAESLGLAGGNIRTKRYLWSGPYEP